MLYSLCQLVTWCALHPACSAQGLERGECDAAGSVGVNLALVHSWTRACLRAGMLAEDGRCKTLDASAGSGRGRLKGGGREVECASCSVRQSLIVWPACHMHALLHADQIRMCTANTASTASTASTANTAHRHVCPLGPASRLQMAMCGLRLSAL